METFTHSEIKNIRMKKKKDKRPLAGGRVDFSREDGLIDSGQNDHRYF